MSAIAHDPLGKVGGMFNILIHRHQLNQLTGDGITRTLPSLTIIELPELESNPVKAPQLKVSTARANQEKRPATTKVIRTDFYSPRLEVDKKVDEKSISMLSLPIYSV